MVKKTVRKSNATSKQKKQAVTKTADKVVSPSFAKKPVIAAQTTAVEAEQQFRYVQVNEFQANSPGWQDFGAIVKYSQPKPNQLRLENASQFAVELTFLSASGIRIKFRPKANPDYTQRDASYAVVSQNLGSVTLKVSEVDRGGKTLQVESGKLTVYIGLQPFGLSVYKDGQLITEDCYGRNLIYSNEAVAYLRNAPESENYFGFGEKAGDQLNKKNFTMSFFNYDNFTYAGTAVIPEGNEPGPLNPSEPLYNSMPFMLATGENAQERYSYGLFLDNVGQTFFNMGSNDYSDMQGKYYFGALYGDMDVYLLIGDNSAEYSNNPIRSVLDQYSQLTGRSAMPPKYAFGYQQGCYGYYNRDRLLIAAQKFRAAKIPIDGLHIDVDFQDNYRTFTSSPTKFSNPEQMFDELHDMGFKCSTNITGIISANPLDEQGSRDTPYPTRDGIVTINEDNSITVKSDVMVPFLYNTRQGRGEDPNLFIANESYGDNNGFNPNPYPTPLYPQGQNGLGTYGFYADMGREDVQDWWGQQYDYLLSIGLDMIWQDMTCPAVVPNSDNETPDKTLPLNLMMFDKVTGQYQANAKIHNAFALNLVQATWNGIYKLKHSKDYEHKYNYQKRNFIIARGGYAGVHRYAGSWTGDSASSWDFLKINIPEVLNFGLSGQAISGCDIGGFANGSGSEGGGVTNYELFTRWMNLGAFLPWYRNHYDGYTKSFQEPYRYAEPVPTQCRQVIELRYRLIQLFYDAMHQNTLNGLPIARALFLNDPDDPQVYQHLDDQFFVGDNLLVAPVVEQGTEYRDVYLPAGSNWFAYSDNTTALGAATPGGTSQNWYAPLGVVPLYVREGAIIPHRQLEQYIGELENNPIDFHIYPGRDTEYLLYQDDQTTTANVTSQSYRETVISHQVTAQGRSITVKRQFDNFEPAEKYFTLSLLSTEAASVKAGTKLLKPVLSREALLASKLNCFYYNAETNTTQVKIFDQQKSLTILVKV